MPASVSRSPSIPLGPWERRRILLGPASSALGLPLSLSIGKRASLRRPGTARASLAARGTVLPDAGRGVPSQLLFAAAAVAAPPCAPSPRSFLSACQQGPRPSLSSESSCTPSSLELAPVWSGLAAGLFLPGPRRRRRQTSNFCPTLSTDLTISYSVSQTSLETRHPLYRSYLMSLSLFPSFLHSPSHPSGLLCHAPRPRSGPASLLPLPRAHQHGLPLYRC